MDFQRQYRKLKEDLAAGLVPDVSVGLLQWMVHRIEEQGVINERTN